MINNRRSLWDMQKIIKDKEKKEELNAELNNSIEAIKYQHSLSEESIERNIAISERANAIAEEALSIAKEANRIASEDLAAARSSAKAAWYAAAIAATAAIIATIAAREQIIALFLK